MSRKSKSVGRSWRGLGWLFIVPGLSLLMITDPLELGSETITLSTTYPSPVGIYHRLITTGAQGSPTGDTYLNRDNGDLYLAAGNPSSSVGIGVSPNPTGNPKLRPQVKLDVQGIVRIGTDTTTVCGPNLIGAMRWYHSSNPSDPYNNVPFQLCDGTNWIAPSAQPIAAAGGQCNPATDAPYTRDVQCTCGSAGQVKLGSFVWEGTANCNCVPNSTGSGTWSCTNNCAATKPTGAGC